MDTGGYKVSVDLDVAKFYWENDQLDVDAVFRPGIDIPSSPAAFDDLELEVQQKTTFCSTKRKTKRTLLQQ